MKIFVNSVYVGNYELMAIAESPQKCIDCLVSEYKKSFGSFKENGFMNKEDWLKYHGITLDSCYEVELNSAFTK